MRISIFGLGYVGAVSLGCLARDGHHVVGVDIDPTKLDLIRGGQTPVIEAGMQLTIKAGPASVVLGPDGVSISGPLVKVYSGGAAGPSAG